MLSKTEIPFAPLLTLPSKGEYLSYDVRLEVKGRLSELFRAVSCMTIAHNDTHANVSSS